MKKINTLSTKDYIVDAIRKEIFAGRMEAGEELTQESLAEVLGVSRMPVREALLALEQEGFLERLPNRHVRVVALSKEQVADTFLMISLMESDYIGLIIDHGIDTEYLFKYVTRIDEASLRQEIAEIELSFHQEIISLPDNKYIKAVFNKLLDGYMKYAIENLGNKDNTSRMMKEVINGLANKNKQIIKKAMETYCQYYANQF